MARLPSLSLLKPAPCSVENSRAGNVHIGFSAACEVVQRRGYIGMEIEDRDVGVVGDIVALVLQGREVKGEQPDGGDPEIL
jgi:hypothetical protein